MKTVPASAMTAPENCYALFAMIRWWIDLFGRQPAPRRG